MNSPLENLKLKMRLWASLSARTQSLYQTLLEPESCLGVNRHTVDLVIEGYPRSGNTFAWHAFTSAQSRSFHILHHSHMAATIIESAKQKIPTLVLIRPPKDASISYCIYQDNLPLRMALAHWINFHKAIAPYRSEFVLARFEEVITDFGKAIGSVNERYSTNFTIFDHTKENADCILDEINQRSKIIATRAGFAQDIDKKISMPSTARNQIKEQFLEDLSVKKSLRRLLANANDIYEQFTTSAISAR